jgi:L-lactate dehydrogenase complex protein LldE
MGAVAVLRRVGCDVDFDARVACCGQPAFNSGYRPEARRLAEHFISTFESNDVEAIVSPSGSCATMIRHFDTLFDEPAWRDRALAIAARTFELSDFLVNRLGIDDVGAKFTGRVTWHDACHGLRELGLHSEPRRLLRNVRGAELVELPNASSCCGFGGTFSVKMPEISVAILDQKVEAIERAGVDAVVSADASCLMQIGGRLSRRGSSVRAVHLAEILGATT